MPFSASYLESICETIISFAPPQYVASAHTTMSFLSTLSPNKPQPENNTEQAIANVTKKTVNFFIFLSYFDYIRMREAHRKTYLQTE